MYAPEKALLAQWEPGQLFTSGGDTLALSTMRSWVLLHTRLRFIKHNLVPGGAGLNQVVSCSGPLRAVIEKFKEHSDVDDVAWFKLKEHMLSIDEALNEPWNGDAVVSLK